MAVRSEAVSAQKPAYPSGKQLARKVFLEAMATIDVRRAILSKVNHRAGALVAGDVAISPVRPPYLIAFGKAAHRMASALHEVLGGKIEAGVVVAPAEPPRRLDRVRYFVGGHPYPSAGSLAGAKATVELLANLTAEDLVIFLISGGGSAIFELPSDPTTPLADLVELNRVLVTCGMPIEQINVLRKHLSAVKGGRLAIRAHPAQQLTIYISDVPDHLPSAVASGPTMPDESSIEEAYTLVAQYDLLSKLPPSLRSRFERHTLEETPKPSDDRFSRSRYFCLLSNRDVVDAAKAATEQLGFVCEIDSTAWDRDYREVAQANLDTLGDLAKAHPRQAVCLVVGGEVTCPVTGRGMGGRNQAFALQAAQLIAGQERVVLSAGTDGRDGNSPTSGAVADGQTVSRARALGMDPARYLAESDSYHFFCALGDTLDIGFTDNNVRDLRLWLHFP